MNELIKIFIERDGMTEDEAKNEFIMLKQKFEELDDPFEIENILMDDYGLEMDYIFDLFN